jgi:RNA polymerase sigma-70 factor (ECF subfamily)
LPRDKETIRLELLVLRCQRSDRQALAELAAQWERRLFFFVRRLVATEEDAWDVLQQTWLHVLQGIKSLHDPQRLPAWLYSIARTTAMGHWRGIYRENAHSMNDAELPEVEGDEMMHFDDAEQIAAGLGRISAPHREALTLFFLDDLTLEEIADVLGIPLGTVKSRLSYAKRALREALRQKEPGHA